MHAIPHNPHNPHHFSPLDDAQSVDMNTFHRVSDSEALEPILTALREEVTILRNAVHASFDLQLDIQRSIRQEVAAAMSAPATLSLSRDVEDTSTCTTGDQSSSNLSSVNGHHNEQHSNLRQSVGQGGSSVASSTVQTSGVSAGLCSICLESSVDSLLYGCGHMCTCAICGRQLLAGGQSCPICRAPIRDVVKAFVVAR